MRSEFKMAIILGVAIAVGVATLSIVLSSLDNEFESAGTTDASGIDKSRFKMAPELVGIAYHMNATPEELAQDMEGKVVLYDIWTYSCINCIRTLPHIAAWNDKYADDGLLIIGIHSPEFEFEKDPANVEMAIEKYNITWPVVLDNDWETWNAFENRYWPRKYVADHEGYIRYDHIGEGAYKETEKVIQSLLEERAASFGLQSPDTQLADIDAFEHTAFRTPELYFGYKFALGRNNLGSSEGFSPGNTVTYASPKDIVLHKFYPIGTWKNTEDNMQLESETGAVKLSYSAKQVNIVTANSAEIEVLLDGKPLPMQYAGADIVDAGMLYVDAPGLYNIIDEDASSSHMLELKIKGKGFQIFTFTFG